MLLLLPGPFQPRAVVIFVAVLNFAAVKAGLQCLDIGKGVLHRGEAEGALELFQGGLLLLGLDGPLRPQVVLELFPAHPDDLLHRVGRAAGQNQPEKIGEGLGQRIHTAVCAALRVGGKDHPAVLGQKTVQNTPLKPDGDGVDRVTEEWDPLWSRARERSGFYLWGAAGIAKTEHPYLMSSRLILAVIGAFPPHSPAP